MRIRFYPCAIVLLAIYTVICPAVSAETEYFAVFMDGGKIGHSIHSRIVADGKVTTSEEISITLSRIGVPITARMVEKTIETVDGKPLGFESLQDMGVMVMKVTGTVGDDGVVNLMSGTPGSESASTFQWPEGALMAEGLRLLSLKKGLAEGVNYKAKVFSPGILGAIEGEVKIGKKSKIDLLGRVVALTEVTTVMQLPGAGPMVTTSYVDDEQRVQKGIIPIMGMQIEIIACAKEFALGDNDVVEVLEKMFLASPQPLGNVASAESITYHLRPVSESVDLKIPLSDNQSVRAGKDGSVIVTVRPAAAGSGARFPYRGTDKGALEAMKPTRYVQSDDEKIIELAKKAVGDTKDAAEAAKRIEAFVGEYITNRGLSIGYASAVEVAESREGDCTEFSVLTAAMCRAVGIPARVVTGIAYIKEFGGRENIFGGHAWVEAYLGGKWVGLDAAFKGAGLGGYDAGHIAQAFGGGNPEDFLNLFNSVGQFRIEKAVVE